MREIAQRLEPTRRALFFAIRNYRELHLKRVLVALRSVRNHASFDLWPPHTRHVITLLHDVLCWTPHEKISKEMLGVVARALRTISKTKEITDKGEMAIYEEVSRADFYLAPPPPLRHRRRSESSMRFEMAMPNSTEIARRDNVDPGRTC